MITELIIFLFFFDFLMFEDLSYLIFKTSVCEDELDIFFLFSALTDNVTFLIIDSSFCGKKLMKDSMKESVKELMSSAVKDSINSTVKDSISETFTTVIFFSIEFSLISIL